MFPLSACFQKFPVKLNIFCAKTNFIDQLRLQRGFLVSVVSDCFSQSCVKTDIIFFADM